MHGRHHLVPLERKKSVWHQQIVFPSPALALLVAVPLSTKPSYPAYFNPFKLKLQVGRTLWWDSHGAEGSISPLTACSPNWGAALDAPSLQTWVLQAEPAGVGSLGLPHALDHLDHGIYWDHLRFLLP